MNKLNKDLQDYLTESSLNGMAESHLSAWMSRYYGMNKEDIEFDLNVNHDDSLEIEYTEEMLSRKLNGEEIDFMVDKFHDAIIDNINFLSGGGANGWWDTCGAFNHE